MMEQQPEQPKDRSIMKDPKESLLIVWVVWKIIEWAYFLIPAIIMLLGWLFAGHK